MKDSIKIYSATRDGINSLNIIDVQLLSPPETMAWLVLLLKQIPDTEEVFPHGKWATIQNIESQLEECAKDYIDYIRKEKP